jgi:stage II sporulation protein D
VRALLILVLACPLGAVKVKVGAAVVEVPLERYTAGVLAGETSVFQSDEALKAMAVAARTYAVRMRGRHAAEGFDFCDTTHCQRVDLDGITARLESIVAETAGELVWYRGKPAFTPYTRDCGGRTEDAGSVWPELAASYLTHRDDPYCGRSRWQWVGDPQRIAAALARAGLRTPRRVDSVMVVERTDGGRAKTLALAGVGESVRIAAGAFHSALGRDLGWNTLRSDWYEVRGVVFDGFGAGHGVGLCQRGADRMGLAGRSYREILAFYYPGTAAGVTARGLAWRRLAGERIALWTTEPEQDGLVLGMAEQMAPRLAERTGWNWPAGVEIREYPDVDTFRNATGEPGWVAARTEGRRIQLQPASVLRGRGALEETLTHELLHVLVESEAAAGLPVWFREGLVEVLAGRARPAGTMRIPSDAELRQTGDQAMARRAYADAAGAAAELVKRYGETAVLGWVKRGLPAEVAK